MKSSNGKATLKIDPLALLRALNGHPLVSEGLLTHVDARGLDLSSEELFTGLQRLIPLIHKCANDGPLEGLDLSYTPLNNTIMLISSVIQSTHERGLTVLALNYSGLTPALIAMLRFDLQKLSLTSSYHRTNYLERLGLRGNPRLGDDSGAELNGLLFDSPRLRWLDLGQCHLSDEVMDVALSQIGMGTSSMQGSVIETLYLNDNSIGPRCAESLTRYVFPYVENLTDLNLASTGLRKVLGSLVDVLVNHCWRLRVLDLSSNALDGVGANCLGNLCGLPCLQHFRLRHNEFDSGAIWSILHCFITHTALTILDVSENANDCSEVIERSRVANGIRFEVIFGNPAAKTENKTLAVKTENKTSAAENTKMDAKTSYPKATDSSITSTTGPRSYAGLSKHLEIWEFDTLTFLKSKSNAKDVGIWIRPLFLQCLQDDQPWSFFHPADNSGLSELYGIQFERFYELYEKAGKAKHTASARSIWKLILDLEAQAGFSICLFGSLKYQAEADAFTISNFSGIAPSAAYYEALYRISGVNDGNVPSDVRKYLASSEKFAITKQVTAETKMRGCNDQKENEIVSFLGDCDDLMWNDIDLQLGLPTRLRRRPSAALSLKSASFLIQNLNELVRMSNCPFITTELHDEAIRIVLGYPPLASPVPLTKARATTSPAPVPIPASAPALTKINGSEPMNAETATEKWMLANAELATSRRETAIAKRQYVDAMNETQSVRSQLTNEIVSYQREIAELKDRMQNKPENGLQYFQAIAGLAYWKRYGKFMGEDLSDDFDHHYRIGGVTIPVCKACISKSSADFERWVRANAQSPIPILSGEPTSREAKSITSDFDPLAQKSEAKLNSTAPTHLAQLGEAKTNESKKSSWKPRKPRREQKTSSENIYEKVDAPFSRRLWPIHAALARDVIHAALKSTKGRWITRNCSGFGDIMPQWNVSDWSRILEDRYFALSSEHIALVIVTPIDHPRSSARIDALWIASDTEVARLAAEKLLRSAAANLSVPPNRFVFPTVENLDAPPSKETWRRRIDYEVIRLWFHEFSEGMDLAQYKFTEYEAKAFADLADGRPVDASSFANEDLMRSVCNNNRNPSSSDDVWFAAVSAPCSERRLLSLVGATAVHGKRCSITYKIHTRWCSEVGGEHAAQNMLKDTCLAHAAAF